MYRTHIIFHIPGMQSVAVAFLGLEVDHWCDVPVLRNLTPSQQKYIAIPMDDNGKVL